MSSGAQSLHMLFFPLVLPGHTLPMLDMAKLFAARGLRTTVITTAGNAPRIQPSIDRANESGHQHPIQLHSISLVSATDDPLPKLFENLFSASEGPQDNLFGCLTAFREPFRDAVQRLSPDCIVSDIFLPWTADTAAELCVPRLVFDGSNFFFQCASRNIQVYRPLESLPAEAESFVIPDLPHRIELRVSMLPDFEKNAELFGEVLVQIKEAESKNYGTLVNSFYELEPEYADYYRNAMGIRAWSVGPLSLLNMDTVGKYARGKSAIDRNRCLNWLDSKSPRSVIYVCFGSLSEITPAQLREIALGLEASNNSFIWVLKENITSAEEWMPEGFEERTGRKGLLIRGWAPQILILGHGSIGGFVTHCGWNSIMEGVAAGLPFVTWPLFADQFYNERLIIDVLRIGVAVGVKEYAMSPLERKLVEAARVEAAVGELMGDGEGAEKRRRRARELGEAAMRAVERDGSSYNNVSNLISELTERKTLQI